MTEIDELPDVPEPTDSEEDFDVKAFNLWLALAPFRAQLVALGGEIEAIGNAVTASASAASSAASTATTAATSATASATAAAGSAMAASGSASAASESATSASASAAAAANAAAAVLATSTTSLLIAVASKTFDTQAGKQFAAGQFFSAVSAANPANYMHGQITSYSGTSLIGDVQDIGGSGTHDDWAISISAPRGPVGPAGAPAASIRSKLFFAMGA